MSKTAARSTRVRAGDVTGIPGPRLRRAVCALAVSRCLGSFAPLVLSLPALKEPSSTAQQMARRAAAQDCVFTTSQNGREVTGVEARCAMADAIDAAIDREQQAAPHTPLDAVGEPRLRGAGSSDQSVLRLGDPCEQLLHRPTRVAYRIKSARWPTSPLRTVLAGGFKRRGRDSNPRGSFHRPRDFQSRSLSRSDTSPDVREAAVPAARPSVATGAYRARAAVLGPAAPEYRALHDQRADRRDAQHGQVDRRAARSSRPSRTTLHMQRTPRCSRPRESS